MSRNNFCVIIPAYNEEKVIGASLEALKSVFAIQDIYVVSDGSTDRTADIAWESGVNILKLKGNQGKASALREAIRLGNLIDRYRYVLFSDADSRLSQNFLTIIEKHLDRNPALIVGTVASDRRGLISAFRTYEYGLSHRVYKSAQHFMSAITVAPGCASLYKSEALDQLEFSGRTLTEDFDLTIQIHKKKLGPILYVPEAVVVTQDPFTFKDFWKQVLRWNTGTWQNISQHKLYLEMYFLLIDNIFWLSTIALAFAYPSFFVRIIVATLLVFLMLALAIAFIEKRYWIIPYIPLFPIFYLVNILAFYYALPRALLFKQNRLFWNKVKRYSANLF
jgi:cellulose synthase/poly-beta-1,6-N-acetylglucosamine synthase-like glycosyltransferase